MKYTPIFQARIKNFKVIFKDLVNWKKWIESLEGKIVEFRVKEWKESRSEKQNNLYWAWIELIKEETGQNKNSLHEHFAGKFLKRVSTITNKSGKTQSVDTVRSTTSLKTDEFGEYLDDVSDFVVEFFKFKLPNPYEDEWKLDKIKRQKK
jgi:hypothetical protein